MKTKAELRTEILEMIETNHRVSIEWEWEDTYFVAFRLHGKMVFKRQDKDRLWIWFDYRDVNHFIDGVWNKINRLRKRGNVDEIKFK